jgi:DNA ligase 4
LTCCSNQLLNISNDSPDASSLLQWKQGKVSSAGNFSDRCFEVLEKRDTKEGYGTMSIGEVNDLLDQLSLESTADEQLAILRQFYVKMNAEEMKWLIRVILRCMWKEESLYQN